MTYRYDADLSSQYDNFPRPIHRSLSVVEEDSQSELTRTMQTNTTLDPTETGSYDEVEIFDQSPPRGSPAIRRSHNSNSPSKTTKTHQVPVSRMRQEGNSQSGTDLYVSRDQARHHIRHRREWLHEELVHVGNSPKDYWTLPRNSGSLGRKYDFQDEYVTPGTVLFAKRSHNHHRSSRKSHRHRAFKTNLSPHPYEAYLAEKRRSSVSEDLDELKMSADEENDTNRSELKVYFRFSKGMMGEVLALDFIQNEPYLQALQAHCRSWLARRRFEQRLEQNRAVQIIQRNCERIFNPWVRLILAIRPLLKCNRVEEELMFLKSELERYKTLVKMLRFENAEYQAKVANLLHLIEQINTKGTESDVIKELVNQISEALAKNQEFWQEMASKNQVLQSAILPRSVANGLSSETPVAPQSPMTQLRNDANFYRNQVEMLKEEADEQQHRSSEHFQGQVSVLSNRMEHLQHLLAMESSKVERLSAELEEMNNTITEARTYERNLEHMVSQLSKQLEQRSKSADTPTPDHSSNVPRQADTPTVINGDITSNEQLKDLEKELDNYRQIVSELRHHLSSNPNAISILQNTPFQPGGKLDLFQELPTTFHNLSAIEPTVNKQLFAQATTPDQEDGPRSQSTKSHIFQEITELKRQLTMAETNLKETGERMLSEIEDREAVEGENLQLLNRISALDRQMRSMQEDFDESINRRDQLHRREIKELTDQLEEEVRKNSRLTQQNRDLDRELLELRQTTDSDENILNDEWESMKSKLKSDVLHYKRTMELLQEEFDQYRQDHDTSEAERQLAEKDERISLLEREQQQWRVELDVQQVKLQNATSLLEDAEKRLKQATRERTAQVHRIAQLESERDAAIREAATVSGRASAEKEHIAAKLREYEEMKVERDSLRRELVEVKQTLAGCTAEIAAEKRQAQARLRDLTNHQEARVADLKAELDRTREELERLQVEFQSLQASEAEHKSAKQQSRWRISELEDQLSHSLLRISTLERYNTDLDAELVRAKADLSASREAANMRKSARTRIADEWLQGHVTGDETEDEEANKSFALGPTKTDYGIDTFSEDSTGSMLRRTRLGGGDPRDKSFHRSNPTIFRTLGANGRSSSYVERGSFRRSSSNILDPPDEAHNSTDRIKTGERPVTLYKGTASKAPEEAVTPTHEPKHQSTLIVRMDPDSDTIDDSET